MSRLLRERANVFGLIAILLVFAVVGILTWDRFSEIGSARGWVQHSHAVIDTINQLAIVARDAETGARGYLLTGDQDHLAPYQHALDRITLIQGELQHLTADNRSQQERLQRLAPVLQRRLALLGHAVQLRDALGLEGALRLIKPGDGLRLMNEITVLLREMAAEEERLLTIRTASEARTEAITRWLALAGAALAITLIAYALHMLRRAHEDAMRLEGEQSRLAGQLRASLDSLSQGVAVFAADRLLARWNEPFVELLELPKSLVRAAIPYEALAEHLAASTGGPFLEPLGAVDASAHRAVIYERSLGPADDPSARRVVEIRRTPMPDRGFVIAVTSMTERVRAEMVLRESQKMQALGNLTGGLAHDFNNLLTVIMGNVDFSRDELGRDHPAYERLTRSVEAAERGAALTHQLLAFARKQPLEPQPIEVGAMLPGMASLLKRTLGEHIEIRVVDSAGLWLALADAAQLENAVLNLALNARDAMPTGGRLTIEVANKVIDDDYAAAHAEVKPGDYVMLAVSDTGHGMSAEVAARAFEPFFTTKPEGRGSGLGLAQVFGFVKQSAGHIKIYSEPGEGTTMRIYLPRAIGPAAAVPRLAAPVAPAAAGSGTVLVVEDDDGVREITIAMLRELGYRVLSAADGEAALALFGEHGSSIDLLLVDVVLPGELKGRALAETMSRVRPSLGVLYMSGYTENAIVHHGRLDDGVQLIGKPFKREQLAAKLAEILQPPAAVADD